MGVVRGGVLVDVSDDGLIFRPSEEGQENPRMGGNRVMRWEVVERVEAFKRDLFSVDLICLEFTAQNGEGIEIDEDDEPWRRLVEQLPARLEGCLALESWFSDVAFPAFETNRRVIFDRSGVTAPEG